jgi:hypothetical protein
VDPDGRDWYREDETGKVFWQKGNENFVNKDGVKYRNIGETYSMYMGDGQKCTYGNGFSDLVNCEKVDVDKNQYGGEYIPSQFVTDNGQKVSVTFSPSANNSISPDAVSLFIKSVNQANNDGTNIESLNVSSTTNHPSNPNKSAHMKANGARGIDISSINNIPVSRTDMYSPCLQTAIQNTSGWLENYGPSIIEKNQNSKIVSAPWARLIKGGHYNHIHMSVPK